MAFNLPGTAWTRVVFSAPPLLHFGQKRSQRAFFLTGDDTVDKEPSAFVVFDGVFKC